MKIEHTKVYNFENAMRGMRNPLESWDKNDSTETTIGENDLDLAQRLLKAGSDHAKFMRQIFVSCDFTLPLYVFKELDTYKVATVANSTSTMHTLQRHNIQPDFFEIDEDSLPLVVSETMITHGEMHELTVSDIWEDIIAGLEMLRSKYIETGDKRYWRALNQLLPQGWLQTRTWTANYATLRNIYFARKDHKLKEWQEICDWIESLPYAEELICYRR